MSLDKKKSTRPAVAFPVTVFDGDSFLFVGCSPPATTNIAFFTYTRRQSINGRYDHSTAASVKARGEAVHVMNLW